MITNPNIQGSRITNPAQRAILLNGCSTILLNERSKAILLNMRPTILLNERSTILLNGCSKAYPSQQKSTKKGCFSCSADLLRHL